MIERAPLQVRLRDLWQDVAERGEVMPGEAAIAVRLGVSRPALREALARMETEGLIRRRKGAGTIVNRDALDVTARFDQQVEFADLLRRTGYEPTLEVLESGAVKVGGDDARVLGVPPGTVALRTVKRWRADGVAVMAAVDVIPVRAGAADPDSLDPGIGLFALVAVCGGGRVEWEHAWPGAETLRPPVQDWLDRPPADAVLTLDLVGMAADGRRCYRALEYHVPGAVRFGFIRSVTNPLTARP